MTRSAVFVFCLALFSAPAVASEDAASGRYAFVPVEDGTLRLDTATGEVSLCTGDASARACTPLPDEASGRQAQTTDLEDRIAALEARIITLETHNRGGEFFTDAEAMDKVVVLADRMMRSFFGMVRDMKRDMQAEDQL